MLESTDPQKVTEREHIDRAMADYLARGGPIQVLPRGAMAELGWTAKQRANRRVVTASDRKLAKAEAEAKKLARQSDPLPRSVRERPPAKPRVRKPKPRKVRLRNGPEAHRPGTLQHEAWETLSTPMTARKLADLKGWGINTTMQRLTRLRELGLVVSTGSKGNMRWSAKCR